MFGIAHCIGAALPQEPLPALLARRLALQAAHTLSAAAGHLPELVPLALARPASTLSAVAGPPQGSALPAAPALIRLQLRISTILAASGESLPDFDLQIEQQIGTI